MKYSITDLSKEFSITLRTIRHYEDIGLISPERAGTVRWFSNRDRGRLKLILLARRLNFSLGDIRKLIHFYDAAKRGEKSANEKFLIGLDQHRARLFKHQQDIEMMLNEIDFFEADCRKLK